MARLPIIPALAREKFAKLKEKVMHRSFVPVPASRCRGFNGAVSTEVAMHGLIALLALRTLRDQGHHHGHRHQTITAMSVMIIRTTAINESPVMRGHVTTGQIICSAIMGFAVVSW